MSNIKPLRISDDVNDLQTIEVDPATDIICSKGLDIDGTNTKIITDNGLGDMTFEDPNALGPWTLKQLLGLGGIGLGRIVPVWFVSSGNATNKWLNFTTGAISSNNTRYISAYFSELFAFSYSNSNDNSDADIELYKNGDTITELVKTIPVRNARAAWDNDLTPTLFGAGDQLSCFIRDQGTNSSNVVIAFWFRTIADTVSSGTIPNY